MEFFVRLSKRSMYLFYLLAFLIVATPAQAAFPSIWGDEPMPSLAPMLKQTTPTVVNIATEGRVVEKSPLFDDPFFRRFFNIPEQQREQKTQGLGSGVIVDAGKGYILTNNHVIENAEVIHVTLHDGRKVTGELVGADPDTDLAVIQVEADNLQALPFADSGKLEVGDFVVAIGSPFGLRQTVTSGIVSALGRSGLGIESYEDFIQTDASINPGNSGGALVNLRGELIGINTAILGPNGGNIGIGFAIPSNMASEVMTQLIQHGKVKRGRLGVVAQDLTPELASAFGIDQNSGAVIAQVDDDTPAAKSGLKAGDVVTAVNDRKIRNSSDMRNVIGMLPVGSRVEMDIRRNGKTRSVVAVIEEPALTVISGDGLSPYLVGLEFSDHESGGVVISKADPRGPGARNGLKQGDVVLSINRVEIKKVSELEAAVKKSSRGVLLNIQRGSTAYFLVLK
jgi:serine protease Do/serine protease DegQ